MHLFFLSLPHPGRRFRGQEVRYLKFFETLRSSGLEIVEKGPRKGTILINYYNWHIGILDTIVAPTYTPIPED